MCPAQQNQVEYLDSSTPEKSEPVFYHDIYCVNLASHLSIDARQQNGQITDFISCEYIR